MKVKYNFHKSFNEEEEQSELKALAKKNNKVKKVFTELFRVLADNEGVLEDGEGNDLDLNEW